MTEQEQAAIGQAAYTVVRTEISKVFREGHPWIENLKLLISNAGHIPGDILLRGIQEALQEKVGILVTSPGFPEATRQVQELLREHSRHKAEDPAWKEAISETLGLALQNLVFDIPRALPLPEGTGNPPGLEKLLQVFGARTLPEALDTARVAQQTVELAIRDRSPRTSFPLTPEILEQALELQETPPELEEALALLGEVWDASGLSETFFFDKKNGETLEKEVISLKEKAESWEALDETRREGSLWTEYQDLRVILQPDETEVSVKDLTKQCQEIVRVLSLPDGLPHPLKELLSRLEKLANYRDEVGAFLSCSCPAPEELGEICGVLQELDPRPEDTRPSDTRLSPGYVRDILMARGNLAPLREALLRVAGLPLDAELPDEILARTSSMDMIREDSMLGVAFRIWLGGGISPSPSQKPEAIRDILETTGTGTLTEAAKSLRDTRNTLASEVAAYTGEPRREIHVSRERMQQFVAEIKKERAGYTQVPLEPFRAISRLLSLEEKAPATWEETAKKSLPGKGRVVVEISQLRGVLEPLGLSTTPAEEWQRKATETLAGYREVVGKILGKGAGEVKDGDIAEALIRLNPVPEF